MNSTSLFDNLTNSNLNIDNGSLCAVNLGAVNLGAVNLGAVNLGAVNFAAAKLGAVNFGAVETAGWVLIHTIWQYSIIALVACLANWILRRSSAQSRYLLLVTSLLLAIAAPVVTFSKLARQATNVERLNQDIAVNLHNGVAALKPASTNTTGSLKNIKAKRPSPEAFVDSTGPATQNSAALTESIAALRPFLMWIVLGWFCGAFVFGLRPLLGWRRLRKLRTTDVSQPYSRVAQSLLLMSKRMGITRSVSLLNSNLVKSPMLIGYFRPLILLPTSLISNIPVQQLEAILAHELAHVRRHDFLLNLMQTIIETLCFYHPAIWWLSARIRIERENCCDDLVIGKLDNRIVYGKALLAIESSANQSVMLAVNSNDGDLLSRIRRIATPDSHRVTERKNALPAVVVAMALLIVAATGLTAPATAETSVDPEFGPESNGLRCRLFVVPTNISEDKPTLDKVTSEFETSQEITFAVQLKNVTPQPMTLVGLRYGEGFGSEAQGKLRTAFEAPCWFEFQFSTPDGIPIKRTQREFLEDWHVGQSSSTRELAAGESLTVVLRPSQFTAPMNYKLPAGDYRVKVQYKGPDEFLRQKVRKHWPEKKILKSWAGQVQSNEMTLSVKGKLPATIPSQLVWGPTTNGLQAAIEFRSYDRDSISVDGTAFLTQSAPRIVFHVRNVGKAAITFVSETGRQGDRGWITNPNGDTQEIPNAFFTGWPIDVAWELQPGEQAELDLLSPGLNPINKAGSYRIKYDIRFNSRIQKDADGNTTFPRPGDFQGVLETGEAPLVIQNPPAVAALNNHQLSHRIPLDEVIWWDPIDGLQAGLLLLSPARPNQRIATNTVAEFKVLIRNTSEAKIVFSTRLLPHERADSPYLIPSDHIAESIHKRSLPNVYRAKGGFSLKNRPDPIYHCVLKPGESVVVPTQRGLDSLKMSVGNQPINDTPHIADLQPGTNWLVAPVQIQTMVAKGGTSLLGRYTLTLVDKDGTTQTGPATRSIATSEGTIHFPRIQLEVGTLNAAARQNAKRAAWGQVDKGIQCGIRLLGSQRTFDIGDTLEAEILWRNTSNQSIMTAIPKELDLYPIIEIPSGAKHEIDFGARFQLLPISQILESQEVRSLGTCEIRLVDEDTKSPHSNAEPSHAVLAAGSYRLSAFGGVGRPNGGNPLSGFVDFQVR